MLLDSLWFMSLLASIRIVRQFHSLRDLDLNHPLDVNAAANATGVVVVGGSAYSIGAAGGWVIGGGHSSLSPRYGLGVDSTFPNPLHYNCLTVADVLQFEIVTPDGQVRTANQYENTDLFWALRGGGGGFGVILLSSQVMVS
jgi:hypothetical protein